MRLGTDTIIVLSQASQRWERLGTYPFSSQNGGNAYRRRYNSTLGLPVRQCFAPAVKYVSRYIMGTIYLCAQLMRKISEGQKRINSHVHAKRHRSWARYACAFRGCGKKEHEASTAEGQEKINSHFQLHAEQAQELIVDKIPLCNETLAHLNNSQSENENQQNYHAPGSKRASAAKMLKG